MQEMEPIKNIKFKEKILIVDDMAMHLETARLYLEMSGFIVFCASDTQRAWTLITEEIPDLILLDVVMPGGNGLQLLSKIQSQYPSMGVIIMTSYGSEDIAVMALKLGAMEYIRKPFKYNSLSNVVEKVLAKQRQIKNQEIMFENLEHAYQNLQVSSDSILHCMSSGVVAVDKNLCIRLINRAAELIFSVKKTDIIGRDFYDVFPFFGGTRLINYTLENKRGYRLYEVEIPETNGVKFLRINTDLIVDYHTGITGVVATFDDITELRRKEEMLKDSERLAIIGRMAAGMAYEIKNPLTSIKEFSQFISGEFLDSKMNDYFQVIVKEVNQMDRVIQDFLQLAKPKTPEYKETCLNELLKEITPIIEPQAFLRSVIFRIKFNDNVPKSFIDPGQIKQVILNLVQNALEAMDAGGTLELQIKFITNSNEVCLNIIDTGCGIPAVKLTELGIPFYTTKSGGIGLGLSISFSIIDRHNGRIEINSREGFGTTFSVYLPVIDGQTT